MGDLPGTRVTGPDRSRAPGPCTSTATSTRYASADNSHAAPLVDRLEDRRRDRHRLHAVLALYAAGIAPQPPVPLQFKASNVTVRFVLVYDMPQPGQARRRARDDPAPRRGKLRHHSGPRFPLESARQAHQAVEGGAIGKVVLEVAEGP